MSDPRFEPTLRLHPLSWVFVTIALVRHFLVPLLAALIFGAKQGVPWWAGFGVAPFLVAALWNQYFYRYGFGPQGLVIREGVFVRNIRQIDYERIENIDTKRNLLHRLFGVAAVEVQTSTGGKPEAQINVLGLAAVEELRERVFSNRSSVADARVENSEQTLLTLPTAELVRFGIIDNRGMVLVAAGLGALYEFGAMEYWGSRIGAWWQPALFDRVTALSFIVQAALAVVVLIAALVAVRTLSIVLALVTLHDFKLTQSGTDLRVRHGLLTRVALTLRLPRIQVVHQKQTLLHRWFARVSVRVDLAGGGDEAEGGEGTHRVRWLAPIATPERAKEIISIAVPAVSEVDAGEWQPLAPHARRRIFRKAVAFCLLLTFAALVTLRSPWVVVGLAAAAVICWWYATMYVRYTRWLLTPNLLLFRYGWLTRRLIVVPRARVQAVRCTQSPFDRRHRMAAVCVDAAGGPPLTDAVRIPYLNASIAAELSAALYASAASAHDPRRDRIATPA